MLPILISLTLFATQERGHYRIEMERPAVRQVRTPQQVADRMALSLARRGKRYFRMRMTLPSGIQFAGNGFASTRDHALRLAKKPKPIYSRTFTESGVQVTRYRNDLRPVAEAVARGRDGFYAVVVWERVR